MPLYLTNTQIDYDQWDACIDTAVNGLPYAYSWYLDIVAPDWGALVMDDYEVVMPLPCRRKWGVHYLFQPDWVQQLGVFSVFSLNQKLVRQFLEAIPPHFRWIDMYLNEGNHFNLKKKFEIQSRSNYLLFLNKEYPTLFKNYNTNTKRNLKKAQQTDWVIHTDFSPERMVAFYKNHLSKKLPHINEAYCQQFLKIMYKAMHKGKGILKGVFDERNELCGAVFFLKSHNRLINLAPVTNSTGREQGAMFLLIDHFIRKHADSDYVLDFEGSMQPSIARFFKGFRANEVVYGHWQMNRLPNWISWLKK